MINELHKRKVISLRMSKTLKKRIELFSSQRCVQNTYNLHTTYSISFAIRDLIYAGVLSLEKENSLDVETNSHKMITFSKTRNTKEDDAFNEHLSCSMPLFLINRVCGVASFLGFNRAEGFRAVLEKGLRELG